MQCERRVKARPCGKVDWRCNVCDTEFEKRLQLLAIVERRTLNNVVCHHNRLLHCFFTFYLLANARWPAYLNCLFPFISRDLFENKKIWIKKWKNIYRYNSILTPVCDLTIYLIIFQFLARFLIFIKFYFS